MAAKRKPTDKQLDARHDKWDKRIGSQLPAMLKQLLDSEVYGLTNGRPLPPKGHGIYLLTENGEPRYVGRTGITERAKRSGKGHSNFRTRVQGHAYPSHSSGTYAYHLTCERFREQGLALARTRTANCKDPKFMKEFARHCARVKEMEVRVIDIPYDALAVVFEVYAATVLDLPQSFATS